MKNRLFIVVVLILSVVSVGSLSAQSLKSKQNQKARLEKEIAQIDKILSSTKSKNRNALNDLSLVQKKVDNRKALIAESDKEISRIEKDITLARRDANHLSSRLDTLEAHYNRLVLSAYKNRDANLWYAYIFSSESLSQAFRRYSYFKNISESLNNQAAMIKSARRDLEIKQETLLSLKNEEAARRAERAKELSNLQKEEKQLQTTIAALQKDKKKYETQLKQKKKEVEALNSQIKRLISSSAKKTTPSNRPNVDSKLTGDFAAAKGMLRWPVDGPITENFGEKVKHGAVTLPPSNGISIAVAQGTPVKAVFEGVVSSVVIMQGFKECILVQHGS
ncbi:MAG: hypothetical protein HUJ95_06375, partial [Bacteroidales bacterium]|nr:hypothetical protein [Bacteroidales bacterium]